MIDAITTLIRPADGLASAAARSPALASDSARFSAAMAEPAGRDALAIGAFAPHPSASQAWAIPALPLDSPAPLAAPSLGEAILSGLKSASTNLSSSWTNASQALSSPQLTMADMLMLQLTVVQSSIQYDLLGKVISKSTQNVEQIIKTQ